MTATNPTAGAPESAPQSACAQCGCTDERACVIVHACHWVQPGECSSCVYDLNVLRGVTAELATYSAEDLAIGPVRLVQESMARVAHTWRGDFVPRREELVKAVGLLMAAIGALDVEEAAS